MRTTFFILLFAIASVAAIAQVSQEEWQVRAIEKYPELGVQGSETNKRYLVLYKERQKTNPTFFENPKWPMLLADELAAEATPKMPTVSPPSTPSPGSISESGPAASEPSLPESSAPSMPPIVPKVPFTMPSLTAVLAILLVVFPVSLAGSLAVILLGSLLGASQRRKFQVVSANPATGTVNSEATLWVGNPSNWSYFGSWCWGVLLVPIGVGLLIILGIVIDRLKKVYIVSGRKVIFQYGLLAKSTNEIRIKDIRSINVSKRGLAGIMGVGSVEFSSAASDRAEVIFDNIANADGVRDIVRYSQEA